LAADRTVELRIFVDNTFLEAFWMDGRVAMTSTLVGSAPEAGVSVFAIGGAVTVVQASVWHVGSIWVSPAEVVARRRD
jgi:sucrose-6-phosphate hydrolase SacC (GH32 family)